MIKKLNQYGIPRGDNKIKGITIHNTQNYTMSARQLFDYLENDNRTSQGCHFLIDDKEIIEVVPLDWVAWHTGKAYDFGNMHTIAIEICSNKDINKYLKGQDKAIKLIKELMFEYGFKTTDIYFHTDFLDNFNCPSNILQIYGNKRTFIEEFFSVELEQEQSEISEEEEKINEEETI